MRSTRSSRNIRSATFSPYSLGRRRQAPHHQLVFAEWPATDLPRLHERRHLVDKALNATIGCSSAMWCE
jgi:hypothetical protein